MPSASRVARAAVALLAAACAESGPPADTTTTLPLRADSTVIGTLTFFTPGTFSATDPAAGPRVTYTNTTSRTLANLSIALQPSVGTGTGCRVVYAPTTDTLLGTVPPGAQRVIQLGPYAPFTLVYVPSASDGVSLVKSWAGRWAGTATEWNGTTPTTRAVRAVSASEGQIVVWLPSTSTTWVGGGLLVPNKQFTVVAGSNCISNWSADTSATLTVRPDSILYRGKAVPASIDAVIFPDSFSIRLGRR